jgi:hypothetical protein
VFLAATVILFWLPGGRPGPRFSSGIFSIILFIVFLDVLANDFPSDQIAHSRPE